MGPPPSIATVEVVEIKPATARLLVEAMGDEGDRVGLRHARGCRSFAALDHGRLKAYGWLSTGTEWIGELGLEISPAPGEAYVWNCVTLPPYRRQGRYRTLLEGIVAHARAEGFTRLWIGSIETPAGKADADAGFLPVLHCTVRRAGPLQWLRVRAAPSARAGMAEEARRRLGLSSWSALGQVRTRLH